MDKKTAEYMEERVRKFNKLEGAKGNKESEMTILNDKGWDLRVIIDSSNFRADRKLSFNLGQKKLIKEFILDILKEEIAEIEKEMEAI
jgi:hypothetical protein